jgi:hypothetical protein
MSGLSRVVILLTLSRNSRRGKRKVELAKLVNVWIREAATKPGGQILRQSLQQLFSLFGAPFPSLLEFHDASPDLSVSGRHQSIDGARRSAPGSFEQFGNATDQAAIFFR